MADRKPRRTESGPGFFCLLAKNGRASYRWKVLKKKKKSRKKKNNLYRKGNFSKRTVRGVLIGGEKIKPDRKNNGEKKKKGENDRVETTHSEQKPYN